MSVEKIQNITTGKITSYRTKAKKINLEQYLREYVDHFVMAETILLHDVSVEGNPVYNFKEDPRMVTASIKYSPLEEISLDVFQLAGKEKTLKLKLRISSHLWEKRDEVFKQYVIERK